MHLAYVHYPTATGAKFELALIPDKPFSFSIPLPISFLEDNVTAFFMVGIGEGVNVVSNPAENSLTIYALHPSIIFLTPDTTDSPGLKAAELRLTVEGQSASGMKIYKTEYRKDNRDKWRSYVANAQKKALDV